MAVEDEFIFFFIDEEYGIMCKLQTDLDIKANNFQDEELHMLDLFVWIIFTNHKNLLHFTITKQFNRKQMRC